ncbi:perlucin-like [Haliotis rubra]|uniref:perlucin-like n=1 Tax=Haliotis rubra TaxID=36100 RepID=UPI001EE561DD|nr:perlucin-like [Haliotis rubra]
MWCYFPTPFYNGYFKYHVSFVHVSATAEFVPDLPRFAARQKVRVIIPPSHTALCAAELKSTVMQVKVLSALLCFVATTYAGCPLGFHQHRTSCYWFSNVRCSFPEAAAYCRYLESHLATIESQDEDSFINGYAIRRGRAPSYFIGATDLNIEGRWMWEGQRRMTYTHWNTKQPDNSGGQEHCLELWKYSKKYRWNDKRCDTPSNFICEQEL